MTNQSPLNPDDEARLKMALEQSANGQVVSRGSFAQPPLNPDALNELGIERAQDAYGDAILNRWWPRKTVIRIIRAYLAVAQPVVTGEQVNLAGWTCNGIHEPGDYSTCEECRDACDDLARFFNHMMRNPRPFKHWTGSPEVKP